MSRPKTITDQQEQEIAKLYASGKTMKEVSELFSMTSMGICKVIKRLGIVARSNNGTERVPSWMSEFPVTIPQLINQPRIVAQSDKLCIISVDPEVWDVDSIVSKYSCVTTAAGARWFIPLKEYCLSKGLQAMLIWKDEIHNPVLERMFRYKSQRGIKICDARECEVVEVKDTKFYDTYHLQGGCYSKLTLGLKYENDIVAMMSFNRSGTCRSNDDGHLLQRFAAKGSIPGGASKLLSAFRKAHEGGIISYSDNRYANGNLYSILGFRQVEVTNPDYRYWRGRWYLKNAKQRRHLITELQEKGESILESDTEYSMARRLGYKRCYDLGKVTWKLD